MDWWHTEGARGGYRWSAPPDARLAFALKKLTSWPAVIGNAIHEAAAIRACAVRDGMRPPSYDDLLGRIRHRLNEAARSTSVDAFLAHPDEVVMLREVYFREWPDGRIPQQVVDATKARVALLLRQMLGHPAWEDLFRCGRGDVLVCDALDAVELECHDMLVRVYAAPDLVWVSREPVVVPGFGVPLLPPVVTLLDWKTGRGGGRIGAAREQLALYAWWVSQKAELGQAPRSYVGRIADLGAAGGWDQDVQFVLRQDDIERARGALDRAIARVRSSRLPDGTLPMEQTRRNLDACDGCSFRPLCVDRPA